MTALQIILALCDVACIIRYRMGNVIARHRGNAEDRDGTGTFEVDCLLVTGSEAAVKIARITTV